MAGSFINFKGIAKGNGQKGKYSVEIIEIKSIAMN